MSEFFAGQWDGEPFRLFGWPHLTALVVAVAFNVGLVRRFRDADGSVRARVCRVLAVVLWAQELSWHTWNLAVGRWRIATMPDGQLGIEVGFDVMVNDVRLVGYIDRVYLLPDGSVLVVDLKSGSLSPDLQLLTYAVGLEAEYGLSADWAAFWRPLPDSEVGELTSPVDVSQRPLQRLEKMYEQASRGINAGVFLPSVSSMCTSCTMKDFCWAVNGERSSEIPSEFEIFDPATGELLVA